MSGSDKLQEIFAWKRQEVAEESHRFPLSHWLSLISDRPPPLDFRASLAKAAPHGLIAEIKKASPSQGLIRPDFNAALLAQIYKEAGASCLSVLTESKWFQGSLDDLAAVRRVVDLPLLRKDFLFNLWQIYQARAYGADAILLIMASLEDGQAAEMAECAGELGLSVLAEIHDEAELGRALRLPPFVMIGVNNRNLKTLAIDLGVGKKLLGMIPPSRMAVAESGLQTSADLIAMNQAGAKAWLIGESLMRQPDLAKATRGLLAAVKGGKP